MSLNLPKPIPVYIESFTGFGLKFEFIQSLYESIIDIAYRKYEIEIDGMKIESYIDHINVAIIHQESWAKNSLPISVFYYRDDQYTQERLSRFADDSVKILMVTTENNGKTQKETL